MKTSKQRNAILHVLKNTKSHPTAMWVYEQVKPSFNNISLATVYRNLNQLVQSGQIVKLDTSDSQEHYDYCTEPHYHFTCSKCKSIIDLEMPVMENINEEAGKCSGFLVKSHDLQFYGLCENCAT